jgi:hypothetical protein
MQRFGRRPGFFLGAAGGGLGAALCALGLLQNSFASSSRLATSPALYMSAQGFYRFAAADSASDAYRPKAISYVMAGGLVSALIGPQLVKVTDDLTPCPSSAPTWSASSINLAGAFGSSSSSTPAPEAPAPTRPAPQPARAPLAIPSSRGGDLRHGLLFADEPRDDLDAARRRRLRLHHRAMPPTSSGPCARDVRALLRHRPPDRPLRHDTGDRCAGLVILAAAGGVALMGWTWGISSSR